MDPWKLSATIAIALGIGCVDRTPAKPAPVQALSPLPTLPAFADPVIPLDFSAARPAGLGLGSSDGQCDL